MLHCYCSAVLILACVTVLQATKAVAQAVAAAAQRSAPHTWTVRLRLKSPWLEPTGAGLWITLPRSVHRL